MNCPNLFSLKKSDCNVRIRHRPALPFRFVFSPYQMIMPGTVLECVDTNTFADLALLEQFSKREGDAGSSLLLRFCPIDIPILKENMEFSNMAFIRPKKCVKKWRIV
ncbi:hypothetical protein CDAR_125091 [Caerostris darwini]|uniref:Uncharacterized protein n=1 Tax=Caerostris darwini TaxID=1538125 RepID=A0AAV4MG46_9ARAC|nr:hypothetical protein CDAR_125091 [Caerostris darwini]